MLSKEELEKNIVKYIDDITALFINPINPRALTFEGLANLPEVAGVYGIYDKGVLIYVGETSCLSKRMSDIFKTRKHTFRRSLGEYLFNSCNDYSKASTKEKFCERIENELDVYASDNLTVFLLPVLIGRKEIEEKIIEENDGLLNKIKRR